MPTSPVVQSALFTSAEIESFATDLNVAFTYAISLAQADWTRRQCFAIESRAAGEIDHERFVGLCRAASQIFRVAESDAHDLYDTLWAGLYALPIRESEGYHRDAVTPGLWIQDRDGLGYRHSSGATVRRGPSDRERWVGRTVGIPGHVIPGWGVVSKGFPSLGEAQRFALSEGK